MAEKKSAHMDKEGLYGSVFLLIAMIGGVVAGYTVATMRAVGIAL
jgi:hypothetical protein